MTIKLTEVERDTILAALRYWQMHGRGTPDDILDIATNGGAHEMPSNEDIDDLCERINI